jgi:hypothetical protein
MKREMTLGLMELPQTLLKSGNKEPLSRQADVTLSLKLCSRRPRILRGDTKLLAADAD